MIKNNYILGITILMKIILLGIFSSDYSNQLFFPFVSSFVDGNLNPWQYYFENGLDIEAFPFNSLMLFIHLPSTFIIDVFQIQNIFLSNIIFKLPLIFADIFLYYILTKILKSHPNKIFIFYFLNPIIIYAVYILSLLDIIPMAFLIYSIYKLEQKKLLFSAIIFGLAISTKHHILVILPLIVFYLYKNRNFRDLINYLLYTIGIFLLFALPFISEGFQKMVLSNQKQSLIFDSTFSIGNLEVFLTLVPVILVYFHFFNQKRINRDLLFFYCSLLFTSVLFFIKAQPGWYLWIVPFVSIFLANIKNKDKSYLFFISFSLIYLIFFIFFYNSEYSNVTFLSTPFSYKISSNILVNISYTILLSMLLALMYGFYKFSIKSNSIYRRLNNLVIGIGGDSAAGKTTTSEQLSLILGNDILKLEGDGEHKWERGDKNWQSFSHLDPKANYIHRQADFLLDLKLNQLIYRSDYNHKTGKFTKKYPIYPKKIIIISSLHPFYLPKQRKIIDIKIYLDPEEKIRKKWKIERDISKRNYSREKVLEQINFRKSDSVKYIHPQKEFADLIVNFFHQKKSSKIGLKLTFNANINVDYLIDKCKDVIWDYNDDLKTQYIILINTPILDFNKLSNQYIENFYEITNYNSKWLDGYNGLIQYIVMLLISEKLKVTN